MADSETERRVRESIKAFLTAQGVTQSELAHRTGMTPQSISYLLRGRMRLSFDYAERMADALGLSFTVQIEDRNHG